MSMPRARLSCAPLFCTSLARTSLARTSLSWGGASGRRGPIPPLSASASVPLLAVRVGAVLLLALTAAACGPSGGGAGTDAEPVQHRLDPPAAAGALAPRLAASPGGVLLSWLEPVGGDGTEPAGHRLRGARLVEADDEAADGEPAGELVWKPFEPAARGEDFFANWADLPGMVEAGDGTLVAHWLRMLGDGPYAYGIELARSGDRGETWEPLGWLHDDTTPAEHGFASWTRSDDGALRAFWLDGRAMPGGGPMALRTARLEPAGATAGEAPESVVLDERVCECCATDAARTPAGPVVVYRDRGEGEIRDIAIVRAVEGRDGAIRWSEPRRIHADGWEIHGCPVNGPAVAAHGDRLAVAWYTAAGGEAKIQLAYSTDGGESFGPPVLVDGERPLGRVDVAWWDGDAVVSWLGTVPEKEAGDDGPGAEIRWRRATPGAPDAAPTLGPVHGVTPTTRARSAGVPRMVADGERLVFVWVEQAEPARLRGAVVTDGAR